MASIFFAPLRRWKVNVFFFLLIVVLMGIKWMGGEKVVLPIWVLPAVVWVTFGMVWLGLLAFFVFSTTLRSSMFHILTKAVSREQYLKAVLGGGFLLGSSLLAMAFLLILPVQILQFQFWDAFYSSVILVFGLLTDLMLMLLLMVIPGAFGWKLPTVMIAFAPMVLDLALRPFVPGRVSLGYTLFAMGDVIGQGDFIVVFHVIKGWWHFMVKAFMIVGLFKLSVFLYKQHDPIL